MTAPEAGSPALSWAPAAVDELWADAAAAAPREAVGALLGKGHHVFAVLPLTNIEPGTTHFAVAPEELLELYRWADRFDDDLDIIGFWHSHPRTSAEPSELDRATATPGQWVAVASLRDQEIQSFLA